MKTCFGGAMVAEEEEWWWCMKMGGLLPCCSPTLVRYSPILCSNVTSCFQVLPMVRHAILDGDGGGSNVVVAARASPRRRKVGGRVGPAKSAGRLVAA